jgi:hypothetical protein
LSRKSGTRFSQIPIQVQHNFFSLLQIKSIWKRTKWLRFKLENSRICITRTIFRRLHWPDKEFKCCFKQYRSNLWHRKPVGLQLKGSTSRNKRINRIVANCVGMR